MGQSGGLRHQYFQINIEKTDAPDSLYGVRRGSKYFHCILVEIIRLSIRFQYLYVAQEFQIYFKKLLNVSDHNCREYI